jgi:hypothetical protein
MSNDSEVKVGLNPGESSFLETYLSKKAKDYLAASGPEFGAQDLSNLRSDIDRVMRRITRFLTDDGMHQDSQLVLGNIQSGKTAHLLGVISALANTKACLCILISGATGALNRQTQLRLEDDLQALSGHPIKTFAVPTEAKLDSSDVFDDLVSKVARRVAVAGGAEARHMPPMPVLAVLESKARISSVSTIIDRLCDEFGSDFSVIIIDDEADQISQNAKAKKSGETEIYKILKEIRQKDVRNCLLSYTATPQAVLLTSLDGALRPRLCSLTEPGVQYFGLENLLSDQMSQNRVVVSDLPSDLPSPPPSSLRNALLEFFVTGMIRRKAPGLFYSSDERFLNLDEPEMSSIQFLVHPSGKQIDHKLFYEWIKTIVSKVEEDLGHGYADPNPDFVTGDLDGAYQKVRSLLGNRKHLLPSVIPDDWMHDLCSSVSNSTQVLMVNSDKNNPTIETLLPSRSKDWDKCDYWILVGGDILGRGVTIPQLVSTYFLRNPKTPQFDTLSQQMRFCGYRSRYANFVTVWAPQDIFDLFSEMNAADGVLYKFAESWDLQERDLKKYGAQVVFVQPGKKSINPTRAGVLDPSVKKKSFAEIVFQTGNYAAPSLCRHNVANFLERVRELQPINNQMDGWEVIEDVPHEWFLSMFEGFKFSGTDKNRSEAVGLLLDENLGTLGLSDKPLAIAFRNIEEMIELSRGEVPNESVGAERGCSGTGLNASATELLDTWSRFLRDTSVIRQSQWFDQVDLVPVVGGTQRAQRGKLTSVSSLFTIEPFNLRKSNSLITSESDSGLIGYGIGLSLLAPQNFEIEAWGFN